MESGIVTNWSKRAPTFPWMTFALTTFCLLAKLVVLTLEPMIQKAMIDMGGTQPEAVSRLVNGDVSWLSLDALSLFTALFLHVSWLHMVGNLAYLWVFGVAVEQRLGAFWMMFIFLFGGAMANLIAALQQPDINAPIIGASGAVSAVVGGYLGLFPRQRIGLFLPLGLYLQFARVPALIVIGSWFTLQLLYSLFGPITGAVAWWTHLVGFALGLSFALLVRALSHIKIQ